MMTKNLHGHKQPSALCAFPSIALEIWRPAQDLLMQDMPASSTVYIGRCCIHLVDGQTRDRGSARDLRI